MRLKRARMAKEAAAAAAAKAPANAAAAAGVQPPSVQVPPSLAAISGRVTAR